MNKLSYIRTTRVLKQRLWLNPSTRGHEITLEVDDATATYPVTIDPTLWQQHELLGDQQVGSLIASDVTLSGETADIRGANDPCSIDVAELRYTLQIAFHLSELHFNRFLVRSKEYGLSHVNRISGLPNICVKCSSQEQKMQRTLSILSSQEALSLRSQ
jgi:hypothetical protein